MILFGNGTTIGKKEKKKTDQQLPMARGDERE